MALIRTAQKDTDTPKKSVTTNGDKIQIKNKEEENQATPAKISKKFKSENISFLIWIFDTYGFVILK